MIYKFVELDDPDTDLELEKIGNKMYMSSRNLGFYMTLNYQQIYDMIGALNEIKKRIERDGDNG